MSTTLMNAPDYDPARERRRKIKIGVAVFLILLLGFLLWINRYWQYERTVDKFFTALEQKNFETAYAIWLHDADWKQHPDKYPKYPYNEFYRDWGPGGEWGIVRSHKIRAAGECRGGGSGVVIEVIVNDRIEPARMWVEKADKTFSYPPC